MLRDKADHRILELSLNRVNPTWLMPQLLWLTRNDSKAVAATRRLFLAKDWLRFKLTAAWHTDYSDVVGALLADSSTANWSPELCEMIGVVSRHASAGRRANGDRRPDHTSGGAECGLRVGTPVVCGSNDTTVELFGAGAIRPGEGAVKLATAGVLYQVTDGPLVRPPVSCYPHIVDGLYYTEPASTRAHRHIVGCAIGSLQQTVSMAWTCSPPTCSRVVTACCSTHICKVSELHTGTANSAPISSGSPCTTGGRTS